MDRLNFDDIREFLMSSCHDFNMSRCHERTQRKHLFNLTDCLELYLRIVLH